MNIILASSAVLYKDSWNNNVPAGGVGGENNDADGEDQSEQLYYR